MTPAARERQLVSLAFGNVKLEEDQVTRPQVAAALEAEIAPVRRISSSR